MKSVFLDFATLGPGLEVSGLRALLPQLEIFETSTSNQVAERLRGVELVLTNKVRLTDELFRKNPALRFIGLTATGTDNVDLQAAQRAGIAVCNIRAYCTQSVAEHVFACLLNLTRNLSQYNTAVRAGLWQDSEDFCLLSFPIRELSSMTLGIVGFGELGQAVCHRAKAFGMQVLVCARPGTNNVDDTRTPFNELLHRCDVISLHCPLTESTAGLFRQAQFKKMKSNAILINTARGGLVDAAALAKALTDGEIAAAAIDVLEQEPPLGGNPLLNYLGDNLLITPHIAWGSDVARQAAIDELLANVAAFIQGKQRNRVV